MKYQLVLQFPGEKIEDFDQMLRLEMDLDLSLGAEHEVVGHDFGSGEMNIFIHTDNPVEAYNKAKASLNKLAPMDYIAAYRELKGEGYTVLHPGKFNGVFCI